MDTKEIITRAGYRREDLSEQGKAVMSWLDLMTDDYASIENNLEVIDREMIEDSTIGKFKREIAYIVIGASKKWLESIKAEIQISIAESESDPSHSSI